LALAIGDPHGIGPEIALKALQQLSVTERSLIKVYGPWSALEQAARVCEMEPLLQDIVHEEAGTLTQPVQWGEITRRLVYLRCNPQQRLSERAKTAKSMPSLPALTMKRPFTAQA
jgi:4-hydroxy-L-threonine phosphate dehydrogenase PdxA